MKENTPEKEAAMLLRRLRELDVSFLLSHLTVDCGRQEIRVNLLWRGIYKLCVLFINNNRIMFFVSFFNNLIFQFSYQGVAGGNREEGPGRAGEGEEEGEELRPAGEQQRHGGRHGLQHGVRRQSPPATPVGASRPCDGGPAELDVSAEQPSPAES